MRFECEYSSHFISLFTAMKKEAMRQVSLPLAIGQELKSVESDFDAACLRARVNTMKTSSLEDGSPPVKSVCFSCCYFYFIFITLTKNSRCMCAHTRDLYLYSMDVKTFFDEC